MFREKILTNGVENKVIKWIGTHQMHMGNEQKQKIINRFIKCLEHTHDETNENVAPKDDECNWKVEFVSK